MEKLLGIVGGVSYYSTLDYYKSVNEGYAKAKGEHASAPVMIYSLDFSIVLQCQRSGDWSSLEKSVRKATDALAGAGCSAVMLASNTLHKFASSLENSLGIPVLHIGEAIGHSLIARNKKKPLLLGTKLTMSEPFLKQRIELSSGCEVITPDKDEKAIVNNIIMSELSRGIIRDESRSKMQQLCDKYGRQGADSFLLACTEIGMLLQGDEDSYLDSLALHADAGVKHLLMAE